MPGIRGITTYRQYKHRSSTSYHQTTRPIDVLRLLYPVASPRHPIYPLALILGPSFDFQGSVPQLAQVFDVFRNAWRVDERTRIPLLGFLLGAWQKFYVVLLGRRGLDEGWVALNRWSWGWKPGSFD